MDAFSQLSHPISIMLSYIWNWNEYIQHIRSTIMSAQAYLLGLYPSYGKYLNAHQTTKENELLRPKLQNTIDPSRISSLQNSALLFNMPSTVINTVPIIYENLLSIQDCPMMMVKMIEFFSSQDYKDIIGKAYKYLWDEIITMYPGLNYTYLLTSNNALEVTVFILCVAMEAKTPAGITPKHIQQLKNLFGQVEYNHMLMQNNFIPLSMQMYITELMKYFNSTVYNKNSKLKYVLYSAHDYTLVAFLHGTKRINNSIDLLEQADFAARLLLELNLADGKELWHITGNFSITKFSCFSNSSGLAVSLNFTVLINALANFIKQITLPLYFFLIVSLFFSMVFSAKPLIIL